jgi:NADH-quinone oxidoreductase subunit C
MASSAPRYAEAPAALAALVNARPRAGIETAFDVDRENLVEVLRALRDEHEYQQLMEIAGVDYPDRAERFEVVYCLLSLTKNHRVRVHVRTDESTPVPSVTGLWPVAGWLEREVFDMYGVAFSGNPDLRRILTDYGFEGYPFRKDFPLTGHVEMRYSEAEKRVVYEPVALPQDFRTFDFLMPWQGAEYVLPGDEKAAPEQAGAPTPAPAPAGTQPENVKTPVGDRPKPYAMDNEERGRRGAKEANAEARKSAKAKAEKEVLKPAAGEAPKPKGSGLRRPGGGAG